MTKKELEKLHPIGSTLVARGLVFFNGIKNGTPLMKMWQVGTNQTCTIYHEYDKVQIRKYIEMDGTVSGYWDEENKKDCHLIFDKFSTTISLLTTEDVENPEYAEI